MKDFRSLLVWQKAHELVKAVYRATGPFPAREQFGLTSQLRRAVISVAANIAEGCGRRGDADFARFLQISMGSACEVEYEVLLAKDLEFLSGQDHDRLFAGVTEVKRMLTSLLQKLRADR